MPNNEITDMGQVSIEQAYAAALQHHQAGRLEEAERLYRQILAQRPGHMDALHLLGVIAYQAGKKEVAVDLIQKAIALKPQYPEAWNNLGNAFRDLGKLEQAAGAFRQAIACNPRFAEACSNLGNVLRELGKLEEAQVACREAIALHPLYAAAHNNLGNALRDKGNLAEAVLSFRRAIGLNPGIAEVHCNLGNALWEKGDMEEALAAYRSALALQPGSAQTHSNLGVALRAKGNMEQAIAAFRQAIALDPRFAEAYSNLGNALKDRGELEEAIAVCRQAVALRPGFAEAHNNLGNALKDRGQYEEAIAAYRQALSLEPGSAKAHFNLALALLAQGDFAQGWKEYEWRWQCREFPSSPRHFSQPQWDGAALDGRTILLHAEQGFGDTIQFIRYAPLVAQRGGRVLLECQKKLMPLLKGVAGVERMIGYGDALPEFAVHAPLVSLPGIFGMTLETIPAAGCCLSADDELAKRWARELSGIRGLKVGIAWRGSSGNPLDARRSMGLHYFERLARMEGVTLISLQKGAGSEEVARLAGKFPIIDLGSRPDETAGPFLDTAAVMKNLDLVITADTVTCHLAGALGIPVWTLLAFVPDWRWMRNRLNSPWYPTMRLFRQSVPGDWATVFQQVVEALGQLVQRSRPRLNDSTI